MLRVTFLPVLILLGACSGGVGPNHAGNERPADSVTDRVHRTAAGCTYARAQAPGRAPTWHIVSDPVMLNLPPNPRGCPAVL